MDRISSRTGKPVRLYTYHISKRKLAEVSNAKSRAQLNLWNSYTDEELKVRKEANALAHRDPEYVLAASKLRKIEWQDPMIRRKRIDGVNAAQTLEHKAKLSAIQKIIYVTKPERKKKFRRSIKEHYKSEEVHADAVSRILSHRKMSRAEAQILSLLQLLDLPYKYVGSGQLMVGRYCPDFKRTDRMLLIEINGFHHKKSLQQKKLQDRDAKRKKFIRSKGYVTLEVDEDELTDLKVLADKVRRFDGKYSRIKKYSKTQGSLSKEMKV